MTLSPLFDNNVLAVRVVTSAKLRCARAARFDTCDRSADIKLFTSSSGLSSEGISKLNVIVGKYPLYDGAKDTILMLVNRFTIFLYLPRDCK